MITEDDDLYIIYHYLRNGQSVGIDIVDPRPLEKEFLKACIMLEHEEDAERLSKLFGGKNGKKYRSNIIA